MVCPEKVQSVDVSFENDTNAEGSKLLKKTLDQVHQLESLSGRHKKKKKKPSSSSSAEVSIASNKTNLGEKWITHRNFEN